MIHIFRLYSPVPNTVIWIICGKYDIFILNAVLSALIMYEHTLVLSAIFSKGGNSCDYLFASLAGFPNWVLHLKERICS